MNIEIIYEDQSVIVCHKPSGFPVQTGRVGRPDCVSELKNVLDGRKGSGRAPYLGIVHRLDQPVEGLLVFAKTKEAAAELGKQLQRGELHKKYYAAASGIPASGEEWIRLEDYLVRDGRENTARIAARQEPGAKRAVLRYQTLGIDTCGGAALLEIELETGRFHQIRVQMAAHGFPLLGDRKYGTEESLKRSERLGVENTALCAYALSFINPKSGRRQEFVCRPANPAFRFWDQEIGKS